MAKVQRAIYEDLALGARAAWDEQQKHAGRVSNMKQTLLHNLPSYKAYQEWYPLSVEVKKIIGERGLVIFSHAISTENDCLLCSTYFRKDLHDLGENPDAIRLSADEEHLVAWARALVHSPSRVPAEVEKNIFKRFNEAQIVVLVAFAGIMLATNFFNKVLEVEVDSHLGSFQKVETLSV